MIKHPTKINLKERDSVDSQLESTGHRGEVPEAGICGKWLCCLCLLRKQRTWMPMFNSFFSFLDTRKDHPIRGWWHSQWVGLSISINLLRVIFHIHAHRSTPKWFWISSSWWFTLTNTVHNFGITSVFLKKNSFHAYLFALPPLVNKYMDRYNWYGRELVWSQANDCKVYSSTLEI